MVSKKKPDQKNENTPIKTVIIKKKATAKTDVKKIRIKKKVEIENVNSKNLTKNENKPPVKVLKVKREIERSIKDEFPLIQPAFWVLQNNKKFPSWINKTFLKYKLTDKTLMKSTDGKFKPFSYQLFLRDYMQNSSPYRGILLMHGLGSGKSCSAITIAENLKTDKNIVAIMPASLKGNFIGTEKEGLLFCGDPKYRSNPKLIDEHYTFISSNASNTIQQMNGVELDNHLIIIDEAHNLVSRMVGGLTGDNKQGRAIYSKLMNARDCKIIALTGTPVVNDIYEAGILMNILHGYMYITIFDIVYVSPKYGANWNLRQLDDALEKLEYIEHIQINKANKTIEFSLNIKPWHDIYRDKLTEITNIAKELDINIQYNTYIQFTLFPDEPDKGVEEFNNYFIDKNGSGMKNTELFKRRIMGLVSYYKGKQGNLPTIKTDEYVDVVMSPYQFSEYEKVRGEERTSRKLSEIRVFTRQYSNFVFPPEIRRPGIGERVGQRADSVQNESIAKVMRASENDEDASEVKKEELKRYQKAIDMALNELSKNSDKYLVKDKLGTYSNKMKAILENIEKTNGLIFVYSDFRSLEGVEIFSRVLNANGYAKYGEDNGLPKYAMYTGSEDLEERNRIKKIFSSPENKYGSEIKIVLATSAGAEGLDLKNIRQVHIMEPYWNNVRIKQVIGRAVRRDSHIDLPLEERDVSVYRYMSLISQEDQKDLKPKERLSADQIILEIAKKKENLTNEMMGVMKGSAVDCVLNAIDNEGNISCISFGENIDGIAYVPRIGRDLGRGTESETRKVEQALRHGAIDVEGYVYFIEGKKLYRANDELKRTPITKIPKISKKVAVDLSSREIYNHDAAMVSKTKIKIGEFDNSSKYKKK
jgi:superfamily II DNA or RNA helicase